MGGLETGKTGLISMSKLVLRGYTLPYIDGGRDVHEENVQDQNWINGGVVHGSAVLDELVIQRISGK